MGQIFPLPVTPAGYPDSWAVLDPAEQSCSGTSTIVALMAAHRAACGGKGAPTVLCPGDRIRPNANAARCAPALPAG